MAKKITFEEGQIFSMEICENKWNIAQLIENIASIKLDEPVIITTTNGNPIRHYGLELIGKREINYINAIDYKREIDSFMGGKTNCTTAPF